jgi:hypothetical protein
VTEAVGPIDGRPVRDYGPMPTFASGGATAGQAYDFPISTLAQHILDTIVGIYAAKAEVATPLPSRQLITIGSVAVDEPLLAVMFGGVAVGPPGNELNQPRRGETDPRSATFNVELWRQAGTSLPSGMPGTPQRINDAAKVIMQDSWLLLESAYACDQLGVGIIANVVVQASQGDMIGASMAIEVQVP